MSLTHALKWSFVSELVAKVISPLVFIVLTRLLTPEDFGVVSSALMVISFSQIFWEAGMGKALIQRQTDTEDAANIAFWVNIGLGIFIATLLFFASSYIAKIFFRDVRVIAVIKVMTVQVFLGAVSSVHTALLQKGLNFKKLFWVRFVTVSLPGIASIPLAWNGMGYWAMVVGALVGQLAQVIMLWNMSQWRPKFMFDVKIAMEMLKFAVWVALTSLFAWVYQWVDTLFLGLFFSLHEVGLFRVGNQLATTLFAILFSFMMPVLFSHFSSFSGHKQKIKTALFASFSIIPVISLPVAMGSFYFYPLIEKLLFNEKWTGVGYIFALISIKEAVLWIFANNMEAVRAIDKPKLETIVSFLSAISNIIVLYYFSQIGFKEFIFGRSVIIMLLSFAIHFSVLLYVFPGYNVVYSKIFKYLLSWAFLLLMVSSLSSKLSMGSFDIFLKIIILIGFSVILLFSNKKQIFTIFGFGRI